jgi:hypothetical protein
LLLIALVDGLQHSMQPLVLWTVLLVSTHGVKNPVLTRRRLDWSDAPADDIEPVAIKRESLSEIFQTAKKIKTPALKDTLRFAPKPMERRGFESLLVSISPNAAVDQRASEVAEKARFQEKETHDNRIAQEEARRTPRQQAKKEIKQSAMRRFDTEQGAIAEQRAMARSELSMATPAVGTEMHSRRWFAKQKAKDKWLLQAKLNAEQSMNQMDTPWFHPGDGTARSIKTGESKDGILSKWNAIESKNDVLSKWNALVGSEAHVQKGYN